jgi:hypothetical protein
LRYTQLLAPNVLLTLGGHNDPIMPGANMITSRKNESPRPGYLSYLLRIWRVEVRQRALWRASLECPHTGEKLGFADLEALHRYLQRETQQEGGDAAQS